MNNEENKNIDADKNADAVKKIKFKDLGFWLKVSVVGIIFYWVVAFIIGFITGILSD